MFLEIHDLRKGFGEGENRTEVLKGISFEVERGEICVLLDLPDPESPLCSIL